MADPAVAFILPVISPELVIYCTEIYLGSFVHLYLVNFLHMIPIHTVQYIRLSQFCCNIYCLHIIKEYYYPYLLVVQYIILIRKEFFFQWREKKDIYTCVNICKVHFGMFCHWDSREENELENTNTCHCDLF